MGPETTTHLTSLLIPSASMPATVTVVVVIGRSASRQLQPFVYAVTKTIWNDRLAIVRSSCASTRQGGRGRLRFAG